MTIRFIPIENWKQFGKLLALSVLEELMSLLHIMHFSIFAFKRKENFGHFYETSKVSFAEKSKMASL